MKEVERLPILQPNPTGETTLEEVLEREGVLGIGRRGFLQSAGFGLAATALAGCSRAPIEKAIPYATQPEGLVPGRADWYASTCAGCSAGCGVLVKTREGRPIKLEGNPDHPVSKGGLCAVGQASLVGLYDSLRFRSPMVDGSSSTWQEVDTRVTAALANTSGGRVRLLTGTLNGPTDRAWIERFVARFANARHVTYDALSSSAIQSAHLKSHGVRALPRYFFDRAETIVSFGADFLGSWVSPVGDTARYVKGRSLATSPPRMSHHTQFEGRLSLTGANADERVKVSPSQASAALAWLAADLGARAGASGHTRAPLPAALEAEVKDVADRLWQSRGRGLVVSDSQGETDQLLCNQINHALDNYGHTLDLDRPSYQRLGNDAALEELLAELERGDVEVLITAGVNPVYDLPDASGLAAALDRVPLVVAIAQRDDETTAHAGVVCPEAHELESWRDAEPVAGVVSLTQPAIRNVFDSRTLSECLAAWTGTPGTALDLMRKTWEERVFPRARAQGNFSAFWDLAVHDGYVELPAVATGAAWAAPAINPAASGGSSSGETVSGETAGLALVLYPKVGLLDGRHAHNPWLQELPDPITKASWDNYACIAPETARELGIETGDMVRVEIDADAIELPAFVQEAQHPEVVAVAVGYGRTGTDRFEKVGPQWLEARPSVSAGDTVGVRANGLAHWQDSQRSMTQSGAKLTKLAGSVRLALSQTTASLTPDGFREPLDKSPRPIVQDTVLGAYIKDPHAGTPAVHHFDSDLWPEHEPGRHHWGLAVDLNACTGCSACVVACQSENNVPVVGRDEVRRRRDMQWMRLDRYYNEEGDATFQPMMCQQCDNAPCETVCPVVATVHSDEGLNQQVYNRCVGTRYCANNCPYKVRRFNWFNYRHDDLLANLALNPEVVVRTRGVMEKCTFCVQRIEDRRANAKAEGHELEDGEIKTACQQSCPAGAIVFGDMADPNSQVSQMAQSGRHFRILEEMNIKPSVAYLRKVRNRPAGGSHRDDSAGDHATDHAPTEEEAAHG